MDCTRGHRLILKEVLHKCVQIVVSSNYFDKDSETKIQIYMYMAAGLMPSKGVRGRVNTTSVTAPFPLKLYVRTC